MKVLGYRNPQRERTGDCSDISRSIAARPGAGGAGMLCLWALLLTVACSRDAVTPGTSPTPTGPDPAVAGQFLSLMQAGKTQLDQGDSTNALALYRKALALVSNDPDVHLNIANASLIAGDSTEAIRAADRVLALEPHSAAAYFVKGSAYLRMARAEEATQALENVKKIDPGEPATLFQLGKARMGLQQWTEAVAAFKEGLAMDPNRLHTAVHALLAQALLRTGQIEAAQTELQQHAIQQEGGGRTVSDATFERSKFTQARVPFKLEQPEAVGIAVRFVDATQAVFADQAKEATGPIAVIPGSKNGGHHLFVTEGDRSFRMFWNTNGVFWRDDRMTPIPVGVKPTKMLVADLQNDRLDDVIVLGENGTHVFLADTNGLTLDTTSLRPLSAIDGRLIDLDFTGRLDLIAVTGGSNAVRLFRQMGPLRFSDVTATSGIPASVRNARSVLMEDWNRDGVMDVVVDRVGEPPLLLEKLRGGPLVPRRVDPWIAGTVASIGDFDNDLRPDLAMAGNGRVQIQFQGGGSAEINLASDTPVRRLEAVDYDNDGWLDLWALGDRIEVWRNRGLLGFVAQTIPLGLDRFEGGTIADAQFADFDLDCDTDVVVALAEGGLRFLRNEGGNRLGQVKVQLIGNRSNASGLGCKIEIESGGLRLIRTVRQLPVEIGVGHRSVLDSFVVHWFNWPQGSAEVPLECRDPLFALELTIQEGSCPYLFAWDGTHFRFITDILGAAPLGLPVASGRWVEAQPEELVRIGDEQSFPPRDGRYQLQITEELREVLYLDEAKLVVVDHEPGTEVHSTDKLLPGKPYPRGTIATLHREKPLRRAETLEGRDVTAVLRSADGQRVSPPKPREPQLRGLAETHGVILDFGPLDPREPHVMVMHGWLRFGGGMANMAASLDPALPFPFPILEAEVAPGTWSVVDVTVGAPAGKTKTILVDLADRLPEGARRLRWTAAFEIHWDRIALLEKKTAPRTRTTWINPSLADLHFRGFSAIEPLPDDWPLTPNYQSVTTHSFWTLTPGGWCTRYGEVSELVASRDEGLALLNGGDELTLQFPVEAVPPKEPGMVRDFFLYADGWDKDSDFHVVAGTTVEPLPFHGMDDQRYGHEVRPRFASDPLHQRYNTRWVEGRVLRQVTSDLPRSSAHRPAPPKH